MEGNECRGVIALNMEDGTFHRFRAHQTILCTGVCFIYFDQSQCSVINFFVHEIRVMVELTFLVLPPTHVLGMVTLWSQELVYHVRI